MKLGSLILVDSVSCHPVRGLSFLWQTYFQNIPCEDQFVKPIFDRPKCLLESTTRYAMLLINVSGKYKTRKSW